MLAIIFVGLLSSACSKTGSRDDLVCQLSVKEKQACSSSLSLTSGVLRLDDKRHQFDLVAQYAACFQTEKVQMSGEFKRQQHSSVIDFELLAKEIAIEGQEVEQFLRTIGLVTLNDDSLSGRFVDIWAMIRTHTEAVEALPLINVQCRREN
jgi:hypothetical protein